MANIPLIKFNSGELSPKIDARSDVEKYDSGCRYLENMLALIYGCAERRPGTEYLAGQYDSDHTSVRMIDFIYSATIAYQVELGDLYMRFWYDDAVVGSAITTPYLAADLFQLQYRQIGDTMWIVHSSYKPRKLTRTSATTFSLNVIDFRKGPFLLRNDLIDTNILNSAYMRCSAVAVGSQGTLVCEDDSSNEVTFFESGHAGALFKLIHNRSDTVSKGRYTGSNTGTICAAIDVRGDFTFGTHARWKATITLERRENSTSDDAWETVKTWVGENDTNVQYTKTEDAENVEYRARVTEHTTGTIRADITAHESMVAGIVRVLAVNSTSVATVEVLTKLDATNGNTATRRWAEGAWSAVRSYPKTVTFFEDRCVFAGDSAIPAQTTF